MLTVNTDTYATLAEADTYVGGYYTTTEAEHIRWDLLSDTAKEVLLRRACLNMECAMFTGRKYAASQTLQFPRHNGGYDSEVAKIKNAQIEQALYLTDTSSNQRLELQKQGVKSYKIGNLQEVFGGAQVNAIGIKASNWLKEWLGGGVDICTDCSTRQHPTGHRHL